MSLTATALNATLKSSTSAEQSSTERLLALILGELTGQDVRTETIRLADHDVKAGVTSDEGEGMPGRPSAKRSLPPIFSCWGRPYGSDSPRAYAKGRWSAWMHS